MPELAICFSVIDLCISMKRTFFRQVINSFSTERIQISSRIKLPSARFLVRVRVI